MGHFLFLVPLFMKDTRVKRGARKQNSVLVLLALVTTLASTLLLCLSQFCVAVSSDFSEAEELFCVLVLWFCITLTFIQRPEDRKPSYQVFKQIIFNDGRHENQ